MKDLISAALFYMVLCVPVAAQEPTLSLSLAIPSNERGEHVVDPAHANHFHVVLYNLSGSAQRVWAPWSEAATSCLSFELTTAAGKRSTITRKGVFRVSHKLSEFTVLQPHESFVLDVDYQDRGVWEGFPDGTDLSPVTMRAVYAIPDGPAAARNKLWTGSVLSEPVTVVFYPK